jgi:4-hydroxybenzoate polyprenyltransferase
MSVTGQLKEYLELVKFEHSIFALPFALSGMLLAEPSGWPAPAVYFWVILAMVGGRTAAMALNRLIDRDIDRLNPRTSNRAIPAGRVKPLTAYLIVIVSIVIMSYAVFQLPPVCQYLLPVALIIIWGYSYTKRFTLASHFVLGFVLGAAAIGGWLAVSGQITIPVIIWGGAVMLWTAGFDIIYSTQDVDFDRHHNLFSLPAKIGTARALIVSRLCHLFTVLLLIITGFMISMSVFYYIAVIFVAGMLYYEQSLVSKDDLSRVNVAFFNINGLVSIAVLVFILLDKIIYL